MNVYILTIIILTHNRPKGFERLMNSIKSFNLSNIKIIINCDNEFTYLYAKKIVKTLNIKSTIFNHTEEVNELYRIMYEKTNTKYVWFLEDDDEILYIPDIEKMEEDLIIGLYKPIRFDRSHKIIKDNIKIDEDNIPEFFQLSQIIFKRNKLGLEDFPKEYNNENDEVILKSILKNSKNIKKISKSFFKQGSYGDNLSLEYL